MVKRAVRSGMETKHSRRGPARPYVYLPRHAIVKGTAGSPEYWTPLASGGVSARVAAGVAGACMVATAAIVLPAASGASPEAVKSAQPLDLSATRAGAVEIARNASAVAKAVNSMPSTDAAVTALLAAMNSSVADIVAHGAPTQPGQPATSSFDSARIAEQLVALARQSAGGSNPSVADVTAVAGELWAALAPALNDDLSLALAANPKLSTEQLAAQANSFVLGLLAGLNSIHPTLAKQLPSIPAPQLTQTAIRVLGNAVNTQQAKGGSAGSASAGSALDAANGVTAAVGKTVEATTAAITSAAVGAKTPILQASIVDAAQQATWTALKAASDVGATGQSVTHQVLTMLNDWSEQAAPRHPITTSLPAIAATVANPELTDVIEAPSLPPAKQPPAAAANPTPAASSTPAARGWLGPVASPDHSGAHAAATPTSPSAHQPSPEATAGQTQPSVPSAVRAPGGPELGALTTEPPSTVSPSTVPPSTVPPATSGALPPSNSLSVTLPRLWSPVTADPATATSVSTESTKPGAPPLASAYVAPATQDQVPAASLPVPPGALPAAAPVAVDHSAAPAHASVQVTMARHAAATAPVSAQAAAKAAVAQAAVAQAAAAQATAAEAAVIRALSQIVQDAKAVVPQVMAAADAVTKATAAVTHAVTIQTAPIKDGAAGSGTGSSATGGSATASAAAYGS